MDREIEFRGKRKNNGEWVYGGYYRHLKRTPCPIGDSIKNSDYEHLIINSGFSDWNMPKPLECFAVDEKSIGQYSGWKDCQRTKEYPNGKKIYSGDITELVNEDGETVRFVCELGTAEREINYNTVEINGFYFKRLCDGKKTFPIINNYCGKHDLELMKVIGDIYTTPELLEGDCK